MTDAPLGPRPALRIDSGVVTTDDGEELPFLARGEGPPLLVLNGLVSSGHHWPFFVACFQERFRVVTWDYRGHHGLSAPRRRESMTVEQLAHDAADVCRAAVAEPAVVCGLSFGVQVALEHWRCHADQVRGLVLICGTYGHPLNRLTASPGARARAACAARSFGRLGALGRVVLRGARTGIPREVAYLTGGADRTRCPRGALDELFSHVAGLEPRVAGEIFASYFEHSARDVLPTIRVPTLIIAGDRDELTPVSLAAEMQGLIPGAELRVFPGHSHLVQLERPGAVHRTILTFLARHGLDEAAVPTG